MSTFYSNFSFTVCKTLKLSNKNYQALMSHLTLTIVALDSTHTLPFLSIMVDFKNIFLPSILSTLDSNIYSEPTNIGLLNFISKEPVAHGIKP